MPNLEDFKGIMEKKGWFVEEDVAETGAYKPCNNEGNENTIKGFVVETSLFDFPAREIHARDHAECNKKTPGVDGNWSKGDSGKIDHRTKILEIDALF